MKHFPVIAAILFLAACRSPVIQKPKEKSYTTKIDFSFSDQFCTLYLNEDGSAKATIASEYRNTDPFVAWRYADTSKPFRLDSATAFYKALKACSEHSWIDYHPSQDGLKVEIYQNGLLVFCNNEVGCFWDIIRPIMSEIPEGYNPLRTNGHNPFASE